MLEDFVYGLKAPLESWMISTVPGHQCLKPSNTTSKWLINCYHLIG